FLALRVFAIWDRDIPITLLVLVLNLAPAATNLYTFMESMITFTADPVLGTYCNYVLGVPANTTL
ncbi:hypothetical protein PHLCEN_2v8167, partial [Hermanssonia centrifuga]